MLYMLTIAYPIRQGTLDPEAKTILYACHALGLTELQGLQMARSSTISFEAPENEAAIARIPNILDAFKDRRTPSGYSEAIHDLECSLTNEMGLLIWEKKYRIPPQSFIKALGSA